MTSILSEVGWYMHILIIGLLFALFLLFSIPGLKTLESDFFFFLGQYHRSSILLWGVGWILSHRHRMLIRFLSFFVFFLFAGLLFQFTYSPLSSSNSAAMHSFSFTPGLPSHGSKRQHTKEKKCYLTARRTWTFKRKKKWKIGIDCLFPAPTSVCFQWDKPAFSFVFPTKLGHYRFLQLALVAFYGTLSAFYMGWRIALVCSGVKVDFCHLLGLMFGVCKGDARYILCVIVSFPGLSSDIHQVWDEKLEWY